MTGPTADHRQLHGRLRTLPARFFTRPATEVAPDILGTLLVRDDREGRIVVRIVETEAYREDDPASHAYRGETPRVRTMFGPVGRAYVYFTYGMHWCMNVSCEREGVGAAVLLRAGAVVEGEAAVRARRGPRHRDVDLLRGPARLTQGLGVDGSWDGTDLTDPASPLRLHRDGWRPRPRTVRQGPRTGVREAPDVPWRWWLDDVPEVSRHVRHPRAAPPSSSPGGHGA